MLGSPAGVPLTKGVLAALINSFAVCQRPPGIYRFLGMPYMQGGQNAKEPRALPPIQTQTQLQPSYPSHSPSGTQLQPADPQRSPSDAAAEEMEKMAELVREKMKEMNEARGTARLLLEKLGGSDGPGSPLSPPKTLAPREHSREWTSSLVHTFSGQVSLPSCTDDDC